MVSRRTTLYPILIIIAISFAVYFNALFCDFVYDDTSQVLRNDLIRDVRNIPEIFSKSVWAFQSAPILSNYYRPLMNIIYMVNYHLFGLKPWGFHLVNILLHSSVSVLVFIIVLKLFREDQQTGAYPHVPAFLAALLFAAHPIHTEAVTWVAGVPDLSFTLFYLLSFLCYIRFREGSRSSYFFSVALFLLATFCKEPALTLPVILAGYDYLFTKPGERFVDRWKRYIPYLFVIVVYFALRLHALGGFAPEKRHEYLSDYQYVINVFPLFSQYLEKLLLPVNLNAFHVFHPISSLFGTKGILSLVITGAFVGITAFTFFKKEKVVCFSLLLIALPLLPALYIAGLGENTFAERYLYLPSLGFAILSALLLTRAIGADRKRTVGLVAVTVMLVGLYSVGTIARNGTWKDDYTLFADTVGKSPDGAIPHEKFGTALLNRDRLDEAIEQYAIALRLNHDYADAHTNLGVAFSRKGLIEQAIYEDNISVKLNPDVPENHFNLAQALSARGLMDKAIEQYQIALALNPSFALAHINLAIAYDKAGLEAKAEEQYRIVSTQYPTAALMHNKWGLDLYQKGLINQAIEEYQIAVRLKPDFADAHNNLGAAYGTSRQMDKAIEQFGIAARLEPHNAMYRENLSDAYELRKSLDKDLAQRHKGGSGR